MPALENPKQEAFCHAIVSQKYPTFVEAYVREILGRTGSPTASQRNRVHELLLPGTPIAIRIAEIKAEIAARFEKEKRDLEATFMSVAEKRAFLARIKRANFYGIHDGTFDFAANGDLIQGIKQTKFGTEYVLPDKLKAISLDNEFPGGGGAPDAAAQLLERLIRPGIPADRTPLAIDGPVIDVQQEDDTNDEIRRDADSAVPQPKGQSNEH